VSVSQSDKTTYMGPSLLFFSNLNGCLPCYIMYATLTQSLILELHNIMGRTLNREKILFVSTLLQTCIYSTKEMIILNI